MCRPTGSNMTMPRVAECGNLPDATGLTIRMLSRGLSRHCHVTSRRLTLNRIYTTSTQTARCRGIIGMPDEAIETLLKNESTPGDTTADVDLHDLKLEPLRAEPVPEVALSTEQNAILDLVRSGKSVFFTGSAGMDDLVLRVRGGTLKVTKELASLSYYEQSFATSVTSIGLILHVTLNCQWRMSQTCS
ncbi:hypothetical protein DAEQUDRAFT_518164 [Daedalea quercina L-15889]|uniref:Uncharacterized protein n=1 Tax=Daedalea quercina L-15889 TaxID=1314783 RepID=A0A165MDM3_9APHY|nr:hypothetical protein DAEQUDRAFT_518164 [Daedalea quercina L-15889]